MNIGLGGAFEANKLLMALFGVPIVIPSVFGILWQRPNTAGVYLCLALGISSGLLLKLFWTDLSWEVGAFLQVGVSLVGYGFGVLFRTSAREATTKERLFRQLSGAEKGSKA